ncbi:MAG: TIGR04086 family membrane protein [bacterium]|nr:TIGR04086 family membrane protein [bacterium]
MAKVSTKSSKAIPIVKALLVSYILTAILLLLLSLIMYKIDPPGAVISVGIVLTYIVSCFAGGFLLGTAKKEKRYLWGMGMGIVYFLIILVVSLIFSKDIFGELGSTIAVFLICGLSGMVGGMIS